MAHKYVIRVTAGPDYDLSSHIEVPVNSAEPVHIASDLVDADLCVRVQSYRGLPRGAPKSSPYFDAEPHRDNGDQYSIAMRFQLKRPPTVPDQPLTNGEEEEEEDGGGEAAADEAGLAEDGEEEEKKKKTEADTEEQRPAGVLGTDLQFGNDLDHPIRDRLPPGFGTAMNIVKWWIDPGLEGDPYADAPYLYGPALSSFNVVHVGEGEQDEARGGLWFEEGGDEAGAEWRRRIGAPEDARQRMKWALKAENKEKWTWEYGRTYGVDFFNPYIDFNDFALRLPGFNLPIIKYWDGQGLRYAASYVFFLLLALLLVFRFTRHHATHYLRNCALRDCFSNKRNNSYKL
ncbi:hypothetical protein MYCTH_2308378 [Thermothelomyces thermophilus ATCC 42464]|uniref:Domain of unknown function at the cortex 1 domain-containing protein n=1 Tax=Thermothelomyces thermophilus (strain ATCC 42464 / BCRC 31852 / DSM 1799) TaxID=573729 RepID=G2QJR4_THET4|nr:uncharacterized protein MYCTH_2308378 [Thermothelomyces thermophilus ATCC 42464]AEO59821.1 hypothetical protein MYCTH_2308378 [Thermothelomyces thermophilus ATCC 42464]